MTAAVSARPVGRPRVHQVPQAGDTFGDRTITYVLSANGVVRWRCICGTTGEDLVSNIRMLVPTCQHASRVASKRARARLRATAIARNAVVLSKRAELAATNVTRAAAWAHEAAARSAVATEKAVKTCICGEDLDDHRANNGACLNDVCECTGFVSVLTLLKND